MPKTGKVLLTWDEVCENLDYGDGEALIDDLTDIIYRKNPLGYWRVEGHNFGWRNSNGKGYIEAKDGRRLLEKVLQTKTEWKFKVYNYGRGIAIQNWHHDSPTGNEWYFIVPIAESTYEKNSY